MREHRSTQAYRGTAAATTLCPTCAAAATIFMKPQQRLPGGRAGRVRNIVDNYDIENIVFQDEGIQPYIVKIF